MANKTKRRILLILILALIVAPAVMAAAWIGTETVIERTSGAEFCARCHTMEPFAQSHEKDVHGGDNPGGVVAACTDCHLPHDSAAQHLLTKAQTGLKDVWAQAVYVLHKPDWIANLEHRANFVYDSGCLSCHRALERASSDNPAASAAHRAYFKSPDSQSCVMCHRRVGHEELKTALARHFDEVTFVVNEAEGSETATDEQTEKADTSSSESSGRNSDSD